MWHHQKQPGYQQKNKSKIGSKAMADECSFCGEWCSRATVEDSLALARTDRKEMDLCPIRVFFFRKTCPEDKFTVSSYFYSTKKQLVLHMGPLSLQNHSYRACRIVHLSQCCMFHTSLCTIQSKKFHADFLFLFFISCLLPATDGDDVIALLAIIVFDMIWTRQSFLWAAGSILRFIVVSTSNIIPCIIDLCAVINSYISS